MPEKGFKCPFGNGSALFNADSGAARREIAIAEGETLMTPLERRRELQALAQKMEFMFLRKAVE